MSKQPTRLSSFEIPREPANAQDARPAEALVPQAVPEPVAPPVLLPAVRHEAPPVTFQQEDPEVITPVVRHRKPKETDIIPRTQVGARIPAPLADRLADYCHYERARQQDVVAEAILTFLTSKGF
jgi:hypothetical protein